MTPLAITPGRAGGRKSHFPAISRGGGGSVCARKSAYGGQTHRRARRGTERRKSGRGGMASPKGGHVSAQRLKPIDEKDAEAPSKSWGDATYTTAGSRGLTPPKKRTLKRPLFLLSALSGLMLLLLLHLLLSSLRGLCGLCVDASSSFFPLFFLRALRLDAFTVSPPLILFLLLPPRSLRSLR